MAVSTHSAGDDPVSEFWNAHPDALFPRKVVAKVRHCSVALMEREAWSGTGIPIIRDGSRCLYRKRDVLDHLGLSVEPDDFVFERIAVTPEQVEEWKLPTRPTKTEAEGNRHAKQFKGASVELDAIPVDKLEGLIFNVVFRHVDVRQLEILRAAEKSERELLEALGKTAP